MTALAHVDAVEVASSLRPVLLRLSRELRKEAQQFGITGGQATLLAQVEGHGSVGLGELATGEGVSAAAMSKHVDRLEAAGLVTRATGSDRRRIEIELTPKGRRTLKRVRSHRTAWLAERLGQLDEDDLASVERAIGPLATMLEQSV